MFFKKVLFEILAIAVYFASFGSRFGYASYCLFVASVKSGIVWVFHGDRSTSSSLSGFRLDASSYFAFSRVSLRLESSFFFNYTRDFW